MKGEKNTPEWNLRTPEGFGQFYNVWAPKIWRHAFLRTSSRVEAEEITAKAFLKVWEYLCEGNKIRNANAFLYKVANHLVIDFYRNRGTMPLSTDSEAVISQDPPANDSPEERVAVRYDAERMKKALEKLNPHEQSMLLMRFIDELSIEEMALALEKSRGAVSVAIHRALKSLQKVLEEDYERMV